jgi:uncharacterized protein DUF3106
MKQAAMQRQPELTRFARPAATAWRIAIGAIACTTLLAVAAPRPASHPAASASAPVREEGVRWHALTPAQREALAPLEHDWPSIEAPRKQKWIALAGRMKSLSPEERARINARMVEWAKLTPLERGQARLRFEEVRELPAPTRSELWRAYQALPPEQRQLLAARAASAASARHEGAPRAARMAHDTKEAKSNLVPNPALAQPPRQVAPTLVQAAPGATTTVITRRPSPPPHQQTGMPKIATTPEFVNRTTLLPRRGPQAAAVAGKPLMPAPGASAAAAVAGKPVPPPVHPASAAAAVTKPVLPPAAPTPSSAASR